MSDDLRQLVAEIVDEAVEEAYPRMDFSEYEDNQPNREEVIRGLRNLKLILIETNMRILARVQEQLNNIETTP